MVEFYSTLLKKWHFLFLWLSRVSCSNRILYLLWYSNVVAFFFSNWNKMPVRRLILWILYDTVFFCNEKINLFYQNVSSRFFHAINSQNALSQNGDRVLSCVIVLDWGKCITPLRLLSGCCWVLYCMWLQSSSIMYSMKSSS